MSNRIIPSIGLTGLYKLTTSLDNYYYKDRVYTCKSIRRFEDIINTGEDVFEDYYQPLGLKESDVDKDAANKECIVGLVSEDDRWLFVPSSCIVAMPDQSGIGYTPLALSVTLGAVEDTYDLEPLKYQIRSQVIRFLGHEPQFNVLAIGYTEMLSTAEHESVQKARLLNTQSIDQAVPTVTDLMNNNSQLTVKVAALETYIMKVLPYLKEAEKAGIVPPGVI